MLVNILALALRRRDAGQLRLAAGGEQPEAEPDRRPARLQLGFLNEIPILWSVLGCVLILGAIYYGARSSKIPSPVRSAEAAESAV